MSEPGSELSPGEAIEQRAADFLQRRRFWDWSGADEAELNAWLAQSVLHRVAYLRLEAGASRVERLAALRPSPAEPRAEGKTASARLRFLIPALAAASVVFAVVFGPPLARYLLQPADRNFATDVGGRALLKFGDGTQIELNTDSAVRYRMTTQDRMVWLDKGEAYFRVKHDAAHPFTVFAKGRRITDLGTEFFVRNEQDKLEVALLKGRARLASGAQVATLTPGDDAVATPIALSVTKKTKQELADELAWQRGVLVFRHTPLAKAIREFNRYNRTRIVIADPAIANLTIGGEFRTDNTRDFLELAKAVLKLSVERDGNDILLSRAVGEFEKAANVKRSP